MLAMCWRCACFWWCVHDVLVMYWRCLVFFCDDVVAMQLRCCCDVLAMRWLCVGDMLVMFGDALAMLHWCCYWCIGYMLVMLVICWRCVGDVLVMCWQCVWDALGIIVYGVLLFMISVILIRQGVFSRCAVTALAHQEMNPSNRRLRNRSNPDPHGSGTKGGAARPWTP